MKSKRRKRVIASVLCMVLMLSTGMSTLAEADAGTVPAVEETTAAQTTAQETKSTSTDAQTAETETQIQTETENQTETKQTEEAAQTKQEETTAVQPTEEASGGETTQTETDQTAQNTQDQTTSAETSGTETQNEAVETQPEETETTTPAEETQETKEEASVSPAFSASIEAEDKSATVYVSAEEGVFPEGTTVTAKRIDGTAKEYDQVEKSLNSEIAKSNKDVLDFVAYDITFRDAEGNEIEPEGEVQVSLDFHDMELGGASKEDSTVSVIHVKDDFSTETVQSDVDLTGEQLKQVEFKADEFSIYAVTAGGKIQEYTNSIENPYATIEFWDKNKEAGDKNIEFKSFSRNEYNQNGRYLRIEVYVENDSLFSKEYQLDMEDDEYSSVNLQTSVRPGDNYYLQKCVWQKAGEEKKNTFGGSGNTGMNKANNSPKVNTLQIYLSKSTSNECTTKISGTKNISVDLYNYDIEDYNSKVGLNSNSLLLRSTWGNYKSDGYMISGNNAHNESCGKTGIYYGLVQPNLNNGNIVFNKVAKFFDAQFDTSVGTKYSNANFEFIYNENSKEYSYNSEKNHVHFNENTNTISQYEGTGPNVLPDGSDLTKHGFFPFTNEADNMTDYGFGMRMDVDFLLNKNGTLDGNEDGEAMQFSFSGDDDVWVFIDGQLALDLGGLHSRRGGTIDFKTGTVTYDRVQNEDGQYVSPTPVDGSGSCPDTEFLHDLVPGTHTLTMYYLERGGNDSNCEIKFNLLVVNRQGTLNFQKQDENGTALEGALFGLYETTDDIENENPIQEVRSGANGNVTFDISNLQKDTIYYMKEIAAPFGYIADSKTYTVTVKEEQDGTNITVIGTIQYGANAVEAITNEKQTTGGGTTTVTVTKKWGEGVKDDQKVPVTVTLKGDDQIVPETIAITNPVTLNKPDWTHTWENLPGSIDYTVEEKPLAGFDANYSTDTTYDLNDDFQKFSPESTKEYSLGGNGIILIKKGNQGYIWTDKPISTQDQTAISDALKELSQTSNVLTGIGPALTDPKFGYGDCEFDGGLKFEYNEEKGTVQFTVGTSSGKSLFWAGTYNETRTITITNNKDDSTDIPVEKNWGNSVGNTEKQSVKIGLFNGDKLVKEVTLTDITEWKGVFNDVPYWDDNGAKIQYTVKEISIGDTAVEDTDFQVTVTENSDGSFTVTNEKLKPWKILKVSASDNTIPLKDAIFKLEKGGPNSATYYGKTGEDGIVVWYTDKDCTEANKLEGAIPIGNYQLSEIQAPSGYTVSSITWTVEVASGGVTITEQDGDKLDGKEIGGVQTFTIANEAVYSLPSSGGPGIFWYTISGALLLMAGTLILYNLKKGEVLKK